MAGLKDTVDFEKEMETVLMILNRKGFLTESDHPFAYSMQRGDVFGDVSEWLANHGYDSDLSVDGYYDPTTGITVYGLFDKNRISYEEMHEELIKEAKRQAILY